uniref:G_PROTEIN_RECEP_F1_2 domain-containing protein n=1 Tax=Steinernema glaseri TaxID=37863 RepID=A0A1I7ZE93_9BILA
MDNLTVVGTPAERLPLDQIEIIGLTLIIITGTLLNLMVFCQLIRTSRTPTASTSFLTGPYQINSFTLFKVNLMVTDFAILLLHALGKVVWLTTYEWKFGSSGCKIYQFLSAFTYYSNSNMVVAIGLDRLKVVYTSHIQGATSVRRVRFMISVAWILAAICALPQLYVWQTVEPVEGWVQCSTIWEIAAFARSSTPEFEATKLAYEMFHQSMVFYMPFLILLSSYLLIVIRLLHYTLRPVGSFLEVRTSNSGQHTCLRMTNVPSSDQHLLSSTETLQAELCGVSKPLPKFKIPGARHVKQLKCLLMGSSFSSRIMQKRRTACLGSIRSCCRNADVSVVDKSLPVWRRQLRSRIFLTSLAVVIAHVALWLPYNLLNTWRFVDIDNYAWAMDNGGRLLEDLIVFNSLINPILYMYETK